MPLSSRLNIEFTMKQLNNHEYKYLIIWPAMSGHPFYYLSVAGRRPADRYRNKLSVLYSAMLQFNQGLPSIIDGINWSIRENH